MLSAPVSNYWVPIEYMTCNAIIIITDVQISDSKPAVCGFQYQTSPFWSYPSWCLRFTISWIYFLIHDNGNYNYIVVRSHILFLHKRSNPSPITILKRWLEANDSSFTEVWDWFPTRCLDQVWSTLSASELLPLNWSRHWQKACGMTSRGGATPMSAKWIKLILQEATDSCSHRQVKSYHKPLAGAPIIIDLIRFNWIIWHP